MTSTSTSADVRDVRRATRDTQDTIIGGVAAGLARHLAVPVIWVRAAFVVTAVLGGLGVAMYAGLWLVLPTDSHFEDEAPGIDSASRGGPPAGPDPEADRRRPGDRAGRARLRRDPAAGGAARPGRRVLAAVHRAGRHRAAVAAGRRGPARALAGHDRPGRPDPRGPRQRRLGGLGPDRRRRRADRDRAGAVLVPRRFAGHGARHHGRGAARRRRARRSWSARGSSGWPPT